MAGKAIFAGIDRYLDPAIPELSGTRRDAMAEWATWQVGTLAPVNVIAVEIPQWTADGRNLSQDSCDILAKP
ncbi:MAG: hypothetical protein OXH76_21055 [Boseongicola sp.]|nr:hypothetical protein [Boseongicola sp.]